MLQVVVSIIIAACLYFIIPNDNPQAPIMGAIIGIMACFWVLEVVPIPITSLLPIILFPLFNIMDVKTTGLFYGKEIIFLFLGGLMLAQGIQETNLHKRIALNIVNLIGSKPSHIILGFMITTGFLSMWISNTASVMVMMPIAISIIEQIKDEDQDNPVIPKLAIALMLCIAYSADIGGMATIIGTPPNMVFIEMYHDFFPNMPQMGFANWMLFGLPIAIFFTFFGWLLLTKVIYKMPKISLLNNANIISNQLISLGKVRRDEVAAGMIFLSAALLWITGSDLSLSDDFVIKGWRTRLDIPFVSDAAIAIGTSFLLFIIPSKDRFNETIVTWKKVHQLPWGVLLLFGGGFAIAGGFQASGLDDVIGDLFNHITVESTFALIITVSLILTFLTEFTSNTATTNLVLPILAKASAVMGIDPRYLMIPATLSASCAFMMPVASPTQAIIFGSGYVKIPQMIRAGILFNLLGVFIVSIVFYLLAEYVLI